MKWATATTCASKARPSLDGHGIDQNVRQVRPDPPHRDHGQGNFLFQALPRSRTTQRRIGDEVRADEENHLQSGRAAGSVGAANRRYLELLSAIDDPSNGIDKLDKITRTVHEEARSYRGFNFFDQDDEALFLALARGEFTISGVQNKALRARSPIQQRANVQNPTQAAHARAHQKASHCYKYYLSALGKQVIAPGLKLKELVIIPELAADFKILPIPART